MYSVSAGVIGTHMKLREGKNPQNKTKNIETNKKMPVYFTFTVR